jgi:hypothetical protein
VIDMYLARRLADVGMMKQIVSNGRPIAATLVMAGAVWAVGLLSAGAPEILQLLLMIPAGGISYFGTTLVLWWANGKPAGTEREAMNALLFVRRKAFGPRPQQG